MESIQFSRIRTQLPFLSNKSVIAILISLCVGGGIAVSGTNYYVSTSGTDIPSNGTLANPWLTIQYAIDQSPVVDGDTINVEAGTYTEAIDITKSLALRGAGSSTTTIAAPSDLFTNLNFRYQNNASLFEMRVALVHVAPGKSVRIEGFTVDGQDLGPTPATFAFTGIMVEQAAGIIIGNTVKNFFPGDTTTVDNSLSGRGIEVLGGSMESLVDSNVVEMCQRYHILISSTDNKTSSPGDFPKATVSRNTVTGIGLSKLAQKGIWFNWGAYGAITGNTVSGFDYTTAVIEPERASAIVIKHGEYRTGNASRVLISGNIVTANSAVNNKGIFTEGRADTISDNVVTGYRFGIQLDDQDSAYVFRNTVSGGQVGVIVSTTTITPVAAYSITIGGSPANKNIITGQDTSAKGAAIALSFRDAGADGTFMSTIPVDARYNDFGVYGESQVRSRIWDRADTVAIEGNLADTVYYYPFYVDKIRASVKVFLQGPYLTAADSMARTLNSSGTLAAHFGAIPIPALAVDSINIELRNSTTGAGSSTRKYAPAWLLTNGTIRNFSDTTKSYVEFDTNYAGQYHIVVRHRNHLAIMDSLPEVLEGSGIPNVYDFSASMNSAFGANPMVQVGTRFALWSSDVSGNGQIRYSGAGNDRLLILNQVGNNLNGTAVGYFNADVDMNGQVRYSGGGNDRLKILNNVGNNLNGARSTQVPN